MRDALQEMQKTPHVFSQISDAQLWVTASTTSECWRLICKQMYTFVKTRAVIEGAVFKSMVAHIKLPVNSGGDVRARVVGGEMEAAAKTVTVPTSPLPKFKPCSSVSTTSPSRRCGTLIIRVLRFETSLGFLGNAANLTCFGKLLRYVANCCCFVGATVYPLCFWEWPKSKSKETLRDSHCAQKASCAVPDDFRGNQYW